MTHTARFAEPEDIKKVDRFLELRAAIAELTEEMDTLKSDVYDILLREEDCQISLNGNTVQVRQFNVYGKAYYHKEQEVEINGQTIIATIDQLEERLKLLRASGKTKDNIIGSKCAVYLNPRF